MPKKLGGIVCDNCVTFVDFACSDLIAKCVVTNVGLGTNSNKHLDFYYCSVKCYEIHKNRRQKIAAAAKKELQNDAGMEQ